MFQSEALQILQMGHNVLITGAAGSGKTTLLNEFTQWARQQGKSVAVTATTGLASTHLNGSTIHNWSGIGIHEEYRPHIVQRMFRRYREVIKQANVLIIDEISMLKDFQLDMVERIVREVRETDSIFGGLQVILCGDFFQLPPINNANNRNGGFVTGSAAYQRGKFKSCFLEEDFRVNENDPLLGILNAIRMQQFQANHRELLGTRRNPQPPLEGESIPVLCDTNRVADGINTQRLEQLIGAPAPRPYVWRAELGPAAQGEAQYLDDLKQQHRNKVPETLHLKVGAVVMFTKNDMRMGVSNGTLGTVSGFNGQGWPNVRLNSGQILTGVTPTDFYQEDGEGRRLATITQVPLTLAWAITIFRSQGMTLDKAYISLENAFTRGLGYVALSRVRRLKDLSLWNWDVQNAHRVSDEALIIEQQLKVESNETLALIQ
jgi:ATP-dependent exoDNAse (exonuclease V) alpha subunit